MKIKKKDEKILVIGAGVSGLTTALVLNAAGYDTRIISRGRPLSVKPDPFFISHYPSASVIPHSFFSADAEKIFRWSKSVFRSLHKMNFSGISSHTHYELFHMPREDSWYLRLMDNASTIPASDLPFRIPGDYDIKTAWTYECYFADWTAYYPALLEQYKLQGGTVEYIELGKEDLSRRKEEIIVNCSELGSAALFPETFSEMKLLAGHLLYIDDPETGNQDRAETISYNITPPASVYGLGPDHPMDVYSYRRKDGWVLGGSRIPATINRQMEIVSDYPELLNAQSYPRQIFELNREVILDHYGTDLRKLSEPIPKFSYRLNHPAEDGLMIKKEIFDDKQIVHNVGHGGAGVTMSWGCSLKVLDLITGKKTNYNEIMNKLFTHL